MDFRVTGDQVVAFKACDEVAVSVLPAAPQPSPASVHAHRGNQRGAPGQAPMHDTQWMAEFTKQATEGLLRGLLRYARERTAMVVRRGGRVDPALYPEELVKDVLIDIQSGVLTWRAKPGSLWRRAWLAIRSRTRDEKDRAEASPHVSLEIHDEELDNEQALALLTETEQALAVTRNTPDVEIRFFVADVVARLRKLARGDRQVLALLDAMVAGATERSDLMHALGMDAPTYARVRRRFDRLVRKLSQGA